MTSAVRPIRLGAVLIAIVAGFVIWPSTSNAAPAGLAPATVAQIKALPHPDLRPICGANGLVVGKFARIRTAGESIIVAGLSCESATAASPYEISAYSRRHAHLIRLAFLTRGGSLFREHHTIWITAVSFRTHRHAVAIRYDGYTASDPMCCPTRFYQRIDHVDSNRVTVGRLIRVS